MAIQGSLRVLAVSVLAAPLVLGLGLAIGLWTFLSEGDEPERKPADRREVTCPEALEFALGSLPAGTHHETCHRTDSPVSTVTGSFRMDRNGVEAWLTAVFPGAREHGWGERPKICPQVGPEYDPEGGNRCLSLDRPDAAPGRASRVEISVEQGTDDARVRFVAFDG